MKFIVMFVSQLLFILQNPLEDDANYKTNKKSKKLPLNGWLFRGYSPKSYKMSMDSVMGTQNVFFKKTDTLAPKGLNYKMPRN